MKNIEAIDLDGKKIRKEDISDNEIRYIHDLMEVGKQREAMDFALKHGYKFVATVLKPSKEEDGMCGTIIYDGIWFGKNEIVKLSQHNMEIIGECLEREEIEKQKETFFNEVMNIDGFKYFLDAFFKNRGVKNKQECKGCESNANCNNK